MPIHSPDIFIAWDHMIESADALGSNGGFRHDLVDITQDALTNLAPKYYYKGLNLFSTHNLEDDPVKFQFSHGCLPAKKPVCNGAFDDQFHQLVG